MSELITDQLLIKRISPIAKIPTRGSLGSAGYDLYTTEKFILPPRYHQLVKTGLIIAMPQGIYGRIAPRSGLAFKVGVDVLGGVIDSDYRGEIGVILINFGIDNVKFEVGDKIAQIIFEKYFSFQITELTGGEELPGSARGKGGFGSTGK